MWQQWFIGQKFIFCDLKHFKIFEKENNFIKKIFPFLNRVGNFNIKTMETGKVKLKFQITNIV